MLKWAPTFVSKKDYEEEEAKAKARREEWEAKRKEWNSKAINSLPGSVDSTMGPSRHSRRLDLVKLRAMLPLTLSPFIGTPSWTNAMDREMHSFMRKLNVLKLLRMARCFLADKRNWSPTKLDKMAGDGPVCAYFAISRFKSAFNTNEIMSAFIYLGSACEELFGHKVVTRINNGVMGDGSSDGRPEDKRYSDVMSLYERAIALADKD
jgi:hypothetical protein